MSFFQSLGRGNQNQNGSQAQPNFMQQLQWFKQNTGEALKQRGYNVPDNLLKDPIDPRAIAQYLFSTGQLGKR